MRKLAQKQSHTVLNSDEDNKDKHTHTSRVIGDEDYGNDSKRMKSKEHDRQKNNRKEYEEKTVGFRERVSGVVSLDIRRRITYREIWSTSGAPSKLSLRGGSQLTEVRWLLEHATKELPCQWGKS